MHALLDHRTATLRGELDALLKAPAEEAGGAYARDTAVARLTDRLRRFEGAGQGLCFGRVDHTDGTVLHIGRLGLHTEDRDLPLLVDWRADAARPFYTATAVHPQGLRRRRHLRLADRTVREITDEILDGSAPTPEDLIGDGPLVAALEARRTGRMGSAVSTLQAEQDAVVRSPHRGVSVVQGGPGTGKTVVALHRAAYVLYAFPRAAEQGVLVLGPNSRFLDYIAHVLPSLGENDVLLATVADLTGIRPTATTPPAPGAPSTAAPATAAPATAAPAKGAPAKAVVLKGRAVMAEALAALVHGRQATGDDLAFSVRVGQDRVVVDPEEVAAAGEEARRSGLAHNQARELFKERLVDAATDAAARATADTLARIDAEVTEATGLDLDRVAGRDLRNLGFDGAATDVTEEIDHEALRADLAERAEVDRAVDRLWPRLTAAAVVEALLAAPGEHLPGLAEADRALLLRPARGATAASTEAWTEADLPLLDEAAALVDGPPERTFGHVVVDEAQELSAMQWRMLARRCPSRSMTLVGDFAQAGPATEAGGWTEALAPHFGSRFALHSLTVSYRTTQEILATTHPVLARIAPEQTPATAIRHGEPPRTAPVHPRTLADALLSELRDQADRHPDDLRAVVCADHRTAELARAGVTEWATVVPASEARGLEFDTVLVAAPDEIAAARSCGERDLYVALTRATKRLVTLA
ncbi:HelD family protein [Kitasatospora sp. NPDC096147]|uniref:HelD family protein n=1 Tax=Kitasatospora sp. NPDC096147 TaxID=3364093 RepID=UPI00381A1ADA